MKTLKNILLRIIMDDVVIFIAIGIFIRRCVTKKKLINKLDIQEDMILKVGVSIVIVYLAIKFIIPTILDIPYCLKGDYFIVQGVAQNNDYGNIYDRRISVLNEEDGKTVRVVFRYNPGIEKGDEIRVQYVPYSGYGRLLEINGEKIHDIE